MQLKQKFVPRTRIGIFGNERTRSTPLDPKLMFWCVSYYLGAFGIVFCPTTLSANRVNWCNCSCHKVAMEFFATNAPDPPHWTLNSHFGALRTIRVHLGPFGCLTKLSAKRCELVQLMQKFMPRNPIGIFGNKRARSTPLDRKLLFWCVFIVFGCICQCFVTTSNSV